ncbi:WD40 repeat domain-containing protein [Nostoc sp.]|uniref:WD40 repeat domain-containing protein n=1 Tax=Nostoc sp. TaxID=1180 RepID=UPI002FF782CE
MGCRYRGIHENFGGQTNGVRSAKFAPDEQTLLSSSEDTTIKIWDFETYQCLRTFEGHTRAVISVVSPDDCVLASGATDQTVIIWDMNEKLHPQGDRVFGHGEWGMGHRAWGRSYLFGPCPMPQAAGRLSLSTHSWDGVSRRFQ